MRTPNEFDQSVAVRDAGGVPTPERARALGIVAEATGWFGRQRDLLHVEPERSWHAVELVVHAAFMTRAIEEGEDEIGVQALLRIRDGHERPKERFVGGSWRTLAAPIDATDRRECSSCAFTPGRALCGVCDGTGVWVVGEGHSHNVRMCMACQGRKSHACPRCDGDRSTVIARVRTHHDRVSTLEYVFSMLPEALREPVTAHLLARTAHDGAFAIDLDRPVAPRETGYRGEVLLEAPTLFGVDVTASLAEARGTLARMAAAGTVVDRTERVHAIPVCVLEYRRHQVALLAPTRETMIAFVAERERR